MESGIFVKRLINIYTEWKKVNGECEPEDVLHFMKKESVKFLIDEKEDISKIFTMGCNRTFVNFVSVFIWSKKPSN